MPTSDMVNRESWIVNRNAIHDTRFTIHDSLSFIRRPDHHQAAVEARYGAADEQEVVAAVDADDREVAGGDAFVAVLAGHADALLRPAATAVARVRGDRAALPRALLDA